MTTNQPSPKKPNTGIDIVQKGITSTGRPLPSVPPRPPVPPPKPPERKS